jgi:parallel beta-helix repeat protein
VLREGVGAFLTSARRPDVRVVELITAALGCAALFIAGCANQPGPIRVDPPDAGKTATRIEPGEGAAKRLQTALINAKAGDVIELGAGRFDCRATLSLDVSGVTVRGQGPDRTILSFKEQGAGTGGEGILVTSKEKVTIEDLAVEDAKGDAIKVQGTKRIIFRNVRTEWTGGPKETNGSYGLYPVLSTGVLIDGCTAVGASDAGIYVGQSEDIVIRNCTARQNVAGIEVENSTRADVYDNLATDNSGGILVFALPDLPKKDGRHCRVFHNRVLANNHANFAPKGNTVATVPPGTGLMVMAADQVEVFDNAIEQNQTAGLSIVSYMITDKAIQDAKYDPFCEAVYIHDNRFASNGGQPAGPLAELLVAALGTPLPDILYDGVADPGKQVDGKLPDDLAIRIRNNGTAGFANFDAPALKGSAAASGAAGKDKKPPAPKIVRDVKAYDGELPALAPVSIEGLQ